MIKKLMTYLTRNTFEEGEGDYGVKYLEKSCAKNDNTWKLNACMCGLWYAMRNTMILLTWLKAIHTWWKGTVNAMTRSSSNLRGRLLPSLPRNWVVLSPLSVNRKIHRIFIRIFSDLRISNRFFLISVHIGYLSWYNIILYMIVLSNTVLIFYSIYNIVLILNLKFNII